MVMVEPPWVTRPGARTTPARASAIGSKPGCSQSAHLQSRSAGAETRIDLIEPRLQPPAPSRVVNAMSHSPLRSHDRGYIAHALQRRRERKIKREDRQQKHDEREAQRSAGR